jgi:Fungal specific transcription factor domain
MNLGHLELLHHFCTVTYLTLSPEVDMQDVWRNAVPRHALSSPFLMYAILALAAVHLGLLNPSKREYYYNQGRELQNRAMSGFRDIEFKVEESNCVAVLLFSCLLPLQVLADPTSAVGLSSSGYIDHFIHCIRLMQGAHGLVVEKWWGHISSQNELFAMWKPIPTFDQDKLKIPEEVTHLSKITHNTSLSEQAREAYIPAIERLQWVFSISEIPSLDYSTVRWFFAWPVTLKVSYLELLNERRPEALVILAYYGTLLHFYRESWVISDKGTRLVMAINGVLGEYWGDWMKWPNEMIKTTKTP